MALTTKEKPICLNTGCTMSLIDRNFLKEQIPKLLAACKKLKTTSDFEDLAKVGFLGATRTMAVERELGRQFGRCGHNPGNPWGCFGILE